MLIKIKCFLWNRIVHLAERNDTLSSNENKCDKKNEIGELGREICIQSEFSFTNFV